MSQILPTSFIDFNKIKHVSKYKVKESIQN